MITTREGSRLRAGWTTSTSADCYRWSFELHGDLEKVWRSNYQPTLSKSGFKKRAQSRDPNETTQALRRFAKWIGRGCERKVKYKLDVNAQLSYELLKALGKKDLADQILMGMPVESDDEEEERSERPCRVRRRGSEREGSYTVSAVVIRSTNCRPRSESAASSPSW